MGLFRGICDETVYPEWEAAYHRLESELLTKRADEKRQLKADDHKTEALVGQTGSSEKNEVDELKSAKLYLAGCYLFIRRILGRLKKIK